jgi:hypothetical protein
MSALGELIYTPPSSDKHARTNWRARQWRARQRAQRERDELEQAARCGMIDWAELRDVPAEYRVSTLPARTCQWISDDGCLCNAPSVSRRSWCAEHVRRVFIAVEAG